MVSNARECVAQAVVGTVQHSDAAQLPPLHSTVAGFATTAVFMVSALQSKSEPARSVSAQVGMAQQDLASQIPLAQTVPAMSRSAMSFGLERSSPQSKETA